MLSIALTTTILGDIFSRSNKFKMSSNKNNFKMSSSENNFIDRAPNILAAGKPSYNLKNSVSHCLKQYSLDDAAHALEYSAGIRNGKGKSQFKIAPFKNCTRRGIFTGIRPILAPPLKTRYQTLINELKETVYESHWNNVVGRSRDQIAGLPKGLKTLETTFGAESNKHESVKELVNPDKGVYQVLSESQTGKDLYKKSHNAYNIGEKVSRNYSTPAFDSNQKFGKKSNYDPRGLEVKCAFNWCQKNSQIVLNKNQADFINKT